MSKGWYPVVDDAKCIGCMICNDMCKHGVYKPDETTGKPNVVYPMGCIHGCHGCERQCPSGAIHYFGDDGTLDVDYHYETYKPQLVCEGKPKVAFLCVHAVRLQRHWEKNWLPTYLKATLPAQN